MYRDTAIAHNGGNKKIVLQRLIYSAFVLVIQTVSVHAATPLLSAEVSPDIAVSIDILTVKDHDVVSTDGGGNLSILSLGSLPDEVDVDGFHHASATEALFSLDITSNLGGITVRHGDVASWDGIGYGLAFDAITFGIPSGVDVDAVSEFQGDLILSFDNTVEFDGTVYADEDLVRVSGASLLLFFDASAAGIAESLDLDAAHVLANGIMLVSFDVAGQASGMAFNHADVLAYDPANETWEIAYQAAAQPGWGSADVDALSATGDIDNDTVGDGFDNCLFVANSNQRDTDNDGIGNICDADLTNDCFVNFSDLSQMRTVFFTNNPHADFNGDGIVNFVDLLYMRQAFFLPPGPSGLTDNLCAD